GVVGEGRDGRVRGELTDPGGEGRAGEKLPATNPGTNVSSEAVSSSSGTYNIPNLLPGTYKVTVDARGFAQYTRDQVQVRTNQITEVNPKLGVSGVTSEISVESGAELVKTDHQLVNTFDANQVVNLPFSGAAPLGSNA